jgi:two-component system chemotaxis response regulator CheB
MPGAVSQAGYADEVLPLDRVAEAILRVLSPVGAGRADVRDRAGARR